jgi:hypothetical protein
MSNGKNFDHEIKKLASQNQSQFLQTKADIQQFHSQPLSTLTEEAHVLRSAENYQKPSN